MARIKNDYTDTNTANYSAVIGVIPYSFQPGGIGDNRRNVYLYAWANGVMRIQMGCFYGNPTRALEALEKKYGKKTPYYRLVAALIEEAKMHILPYDSKKNYSSIVERQEAKNKKKKKK